MNNFWLVYSGKLSWWLEIYSEHHGEICTQFLVATSEVTSEFDTFGAKRETGANYCCQFLFSLLKLGMTFSEQYTLNNNKCF